MHQLAGIISQLEENGNVDAVLTSLFVWVTVGGVLSANAEISDDVTRCIGAASAAFGRLESFVMARYSFKRKR